MSTASPAPLPCPDWVWATGSNVHVAKDRSWFSDDYVPFESEVKTVVGAHTVPVVGIGTVLLPTKRSLKKSGPAAHAILRLEDVLHVPNGICNLVGWPLVEEYDVVGMKTIRSKDGKVVALLEHKRLFTVKLSGPPVGPKVGPSVFKENMLYSVSVTWPESERQRWNDFKAQRDRLTKRMRIDSDLILDPPKEKSEMALDDNEKKWLKENFGGEYRFMQMHGLKIYDEEDRREGRAILRGFMAVDKKYKK